MSWWSLLGSGEFQPWSDAADRWLLQRTNGDGRVVILPTASAPEGDGVFDTWGSKGLAHFSTLGVPAEVLPLKRREDAENPDLVRRMETASVVYFSGGNPAYIASTLRDTPFWRRLLERLDEGMGYAGCSAGVACLNERTFDSTSDSFESVFKSGLAVMPRAVFGPHWDMVDTWIPGAADFIVGSVPTGDLFVGLDEDTAMLGDGRTWEVVGRSGIHVRDTEGWVSYREGDRFELELVSEPLVEKA
jgi:cyanophycinase